MGNYMYSWHSTAWVFFLNIHLQQRFHITTFTALSIEPVIFQCQENSETYHEEIKKS